MRAAVCIPWRAGEAHRERAFEYVKAHYLATGLPVLIGTSDGEMFNLSAARNACVAAVPDFDAVFFADADTFVPHEQMTAALNQARETGQLIVAYDGLMCLNSNATRAALKGSLSRSGRRIKRHVSSALAVPMSMWRSVGGFDERFVGWGGEDRAFWLACNVRCGQLDCLRVAGTAYHLWHPTSPRQNTDFPLRQENIELGQRYMVAAGRMGSVGALPTIGDGIDVLPDPEAMDALLREPGGPLDASRVPLGRVTDFLYPEGVP